MFLSLVAMVVLMSLKPKAPMPKNLSSKVKKVVRVLLMEKKSLKKRMTKKFLALLVARSVSHKLKKHSTVLPKV